MAHELPEQVEVNVNGEGFSRAHQFASRLRQLRPSPRPHQSTWLPEVSKSSRAPLWRFKLDPTSKAQIVLLAVAILGLAAGFGVASAGFVVMIAALTGYVLVHEEPATDRDHAILEDLQGQDQFLVQVDVFQLRPLGSDRGVMWIEDDLLVF